MIITIITSHELISLYLGANAHSLVLHWNISDPLPSNSGKKNYTFNYPGEQVTKLQAYIRQLQQSVIFTFFSVAFWQFTNNNLRENK